MGTTVRIKGDTVYKVQPCTVPGTQRAVPQLVVNLIQLAARIDSFWEPSPVLCDRAMELNKTWSLSLRTSWLNKERHTGSSISALEVPGVGMKPYTRLLRQCGI